MAELWDSVVTVVETYIGVELPQKLLDVHSTLFTQLHVRLSSNVARRKMFGMT